MAQLTLKPTSNFRGGNINSFLERFFEDTNLMTSSRGSFIPKVDIAETEKEFEIQVAVPGLEKSDFQIAIEEDRLIVSGERKLKEEKKEKNYHSIETHYGSFSRSFYIPENVDKAAIEATYEGGILRLSLPKDEKKNVKKLVEVK
ncbi:Hsp20/alpha crystallin family protein [Peijinzhouia sedimentorum]